MRTSKLQVPREDYEQRRDRMRKFLEIDAPDLLIACAAENLANCFKKSWSGAIRMWYIRKTPGWLLRLTSKDYRETLDLVEEWDDEHLSQ